MATTTLVETSQSLKLGSGALVTGTLDMREFTGEEALSAPFEFKLLMTSDTKNLDLDGYIGQSATVMFDAQDGIRYFNGVIGEMSQQQTTQDNVADDTTLYEAKLYPKFWTLKFVTDCRIFQNQTTLEIITTVLNENGVSSISNRTTTHGQQPREYCVQYNETCFDFVSRLMEEEGIYYYFQHQDGDHTMVLADMPGGHDPCPVVSTGQFMKSQTSDYYENIISYCKSLERFTPSSQALADYNFTTATTPLYASMPGVAKGGLIYQYATETDHEDCPNQTKVSYYTGNRHDAALWPQKALEGKSTVPFFTSGHQFDLVGYDKPGADGSYVLYRVRHHITASTYLYQGHAIYENDFLAFPFSVVFRPAERTPKPRIYSTQTARVTGPPSEEIWTDEYGRIKLKFHWDESGPHAGPSDDKSSCWVRVREGWAGDSWGILFTPRIGMEAIVSFLDGNPDRPLVVGCVWNNPGHMPPYLPQVPTKSTIKSHSTKMGGPDNYNEFRYEDLKGSEQVYFQAEKDHDLYIKQNVTEHIEYGSQWWWIDRGNRDTAVLRKDGAKPKTTPLGQDLPAGDGDDNLEITGGNLNVSMLSSHGPIAHNHYIVNGDYNYKISTGSRFSLQGKGTFFHQMDDGGYDQCMLKGDKSLTILEGWRSKYIQKGNDSLQIANGNQSMYINEGNQYTNINQGERIKIVDQGGDFEVVWQGDKYSTIGQGNNVWKIYQGDQNIQLFSGNRTKELFAGNEYYFNNGNFDQDVTGNYTLNVTGNLTVCVDGLISLVGMQGISLFSPQNITLAAGENINLEAGMSINVDAGIDISEMAGIDISMNAGVNINGDAGVDIAFTAGVDVTAEAGVDVNLTAGVDVSVEAGAAITMEAGAIIEETAAIIMLNG